MADDWKEQLAKKTGYKTPEKEHSHPLKKITFWEDKKNKILSKDLLEAQARKKAILFIHPKSDNSKLGNRNPDMTSAQLRRHHNDIKELESRVVAAQQEGQFARMLPLIKMVKSKVAYACPKNGRDRKVPQEFRNFIDEAIDAIEDYEDFKAFVLYFDAVVGYFYGEGGRK